MGLPRVLTIDFLHRAYRLGTLTPLDVVDVVIERLESWPDPAVWISRFPADELRAAARALMAAGGPSDDRPLWGIPFAVKDNIDCAGLETTAACPAFAYRPAADSTVVARLRAAGAIPVGKTNLDQFATGLNGTRSPYGAPRSVFSADHISGGSSSGSAVAVGAGLVAFSLGTDTAGSGRVPAAFNNLVGVKPTKGMLSTAGLVPACRSLDCISVFAATAGEADLVRRIAAAPDAADAYSRAAPDVLLPTAGLRVGVPVGAEREFHGDTANEALYERAIAALAGFGCSIVEIDYAPLREAANLLYNGPWVAERLAAVEDFHAAHADRMDPTVRKIVEGAVGVSAVAAFRGHYELEAYRQKAKAIFAAVDILLLPTTPLFPTVAEMLADPIGLNAKLGRYTNFVNLLDFAGIAVPAGFRPDGLPWGVTLIGPAFSDAALAVWGDRLHKALGEGLGIERAADLAAAPAPTGPKVDSVEVAVVGAHLSGMPLNHQLTQPGGTLVKRCRTTRDYRLFALPGTVPPKPGLIHQPGFEGPGLEVEVWSLPVAAFGQFVSAIPGPLCIGKLLLDDGSAVSGFLCEAHAVQGAPEITQLGGWRAYCAGA
ncbi:allophanate hydrolase [Zavarzinia compransoris]|uniref:Allophanate hydrolase n=1 Tax=Zavarzinia compransoris TaxID=1264899 RepID=A0A317E6E0_9PROT|nr:allophanate hydrolase [Zavarzinia compransoris]PWR21864.1 allophanate hydrolase [Zavarzinia compransoris]TDP45331.1 allophanate hydrolase [Zavarzinia compransoris]